MKPERVMWIADEAAEYCHRATVELAYPMASIKAHITSAIVAALAEEREEIAKMCDDCDEPALIAKVIRSRAKESRND